MLWEQLFLINWNSSKGMDQREPLFQWILSACSGLTLAAESQIMGMGSEEICGGCTGGKGNVLLNILLSMWKVHILSRHTHLLLLPLWPFWTEVTMKMQWREKTSAKRQGSELGHYKDDCFWRWNYNKNRLKSLKMQNQCQRKEARMISKLVYRQLSHSTSQTLSIGGRHPGIFSHTKLLGMLYVLTRMEKLDL